MTKEENIILGEIWHQVIEASLSLYNISLVIDKLNDPKNITKIYEERNKADKLLDSVKLNIEKLMKG